MLCGIIFVLYKMRKSYGMWDNTFLFSRCLIKRSTTSSVQKVIFFAKKVIIQTYNLCSTACILNMELLIVLPKQR